jgi:glycolate oxidase FAD binding subunit
MALASLSPALAELIARTDPAIFAPPGPDEPLPPVQAGGVGLVARPRDIEMLAGVLRAANDLGLTVVPRGSGSKLDRGNPATRADVVLDISAIDAILDHAAGDLTVSVQAGVPLARLQAHLAQAVQFLALDPPVVGTVGGLVATGDSGPRRLRYGGVRDQILGVTFVRADGVVAHGGGRVVKNVAGYDLPKLLTGSLGTLGVITAAVFRLYALPPASVTVAVDGPTPAEAAALAARIVDSPLVPTMLDFRQGPDGVTCLAVRFEGPPQSAAAQAERTRTLIGRGDLLTGDAEQALWAALDTVADSPTLARLIAPPTALGGLLALARRESDQAGVPLTIRAHLGHGHALLGWPAEAAPALLLAVRRQAEGADGNLVLWRAPAPLRLAVEAWGDPGEGLALMRRIKDQFDPRHTLNPGRFVGGI